MKKALRIFIIPVILVCSLLLSTGCSLADLFKPQDPAGKSVSRIELTKDIKANYLVGDQLDLQDAKLRIVYSDESTSEIEITVTMLSGFDTSTIGSKTLTITYAEKTATYPYTVKYLIEMGTFYLTKIENYDLTTGNLVNTVTPNINGYLEFSADKTCKYIMNPNDLTDTTNNINGTWETDKTNNTINFSLANGSNTLVFNIITSTKVTQLIDDYYGYNTIWYFEYEE